MYGPDFHYRSDTHCPNDVNVSDSEMWSGKEKVANNMQLRTMNIANFFKSQNSSIISPTAPDAKPYIKAMGKLPMLIYNYAIGVANYAEGEQLGDLLLLPTTQAMFINHHFHPESRNAKMVWGGDEKTQAGLDGKEQEWFFTGDTTGSAQMTVDFVATKDIEKGEEIFMDYGQAWETAWTTHLENWKVSEPPRAKRREARRAEPSRDRSEPSPKRAANEASRHQKRAAKKASRERTEPRTNRAANEANSLAAL